MFQEKNLCFCCLICFQVVYKTLSFMFKVIFRLSIMTCFCGQNDFFLKTSRLAQSVFASPSSHRLLLSEESICKALGAFLWQELHQTEINFRLPDSFVFQVETLLHRWTRAPRCGVTWRVRHDAGDAHCATLLEGVSVSATSDPSFIYIYHIYSTILYPNPVYLSRFSPFWKRKNLGKTTAKITPLSHRHVPMKKNTHIHLYIYIYYNTLYSHTDSRSVVYKA